MIPISYNIRSLLGRRATTGAAVFGIALVVFVLSSALMLGEGIKKTLAMTGSDDRAIVMRKGSDGELSSGVEQANIAVIGAAPGVKQAGGAPMVVGEVVLVVAMNKLGGDGTGVSNVTIRGTPDGVWEFRPNARVVEGKKPQPGTNEVVVGARVFGNFKEIARMGGTFDLKKNRPVQIVGIFEDGGSSFESEVWGDLDTIRQAFGREGSVSAVRAQLISPSAFDAFEEVVESDKRLGLDAIRETDFYKDQGQDTGVFITVLGSVISFFFAAGAIIGAMITMYASVAHRQKEIGTLRALGFPRTTILGSFLLESTVISIAGGLIGMIASLGMGAVKFSMMNQASWSEIVFSFTPTTMTVGVALLVSGVMGLVGGFLPALSAARMQPVQAMRE
jgi:putative ABC transport system permease protein